MSDYCLSVKFDLSAGIAASGGKSGRATRTDAIRAHVAFGKEDECLFRAKQS